MFDFTRRTPMSIEPVFYNPDDEPMIVGPWKHVTFNGKSTVSLKRGEWVVSDRIYVTPETLPGGVFQFIPLAA